MIEQTEQSPAGGSDSQPPAENGQQELQEKKLPPPADTDQPSAPPTDENPPPGGSEGGDVKYPTLPPPPPDGEPPQYYVAVSETPSLDGVPPPPEYVPPEVQGVLPPGQTYFQINTPPFIDGSMGVGAPPSLFLSIEFFSFSCSFRQKYGKQECIPVGCVPPVCWPYPVVSYVSWGGGSAQPSL